MRNLGGLERNSTALLCVLIFFVCTPSLANEKHFPPEAELKSLVEKRINQKFSVGIVLGVIEKDGATTIVSAGDSGAGREPLRENSVFEIASITKVFTTTLLALLAQKGNVSLSDPIERYLPEGVHAPVYMAAFNGFSNSDELINQNTYLFKNYNNNQITFESLATHHSGLPRMPTNWVFSDRANPYTDYSVDLMYEFLTNHILSRNVGESYEYSNLGMGLLGQLLGEVDGSSYSELVSKEILAPLNMSMTGVNFNDFQKQWMVQGHNTYGEPVPNWDFTSLDAAGAIRSTAKDMLRFLDANIGEPKTPLEKAMRETHTVRESADYNEMVALGWHVLDDKGSKIIYHTGRTGGFISFAGFDPKKEIGVVVLANSGGEVRDIGLHLLNRRHHLGTVYAINHRQEIVLNKKYLERVLGKYKDAEGNVGEFYVKENQLFIKVNSEVPYQVFAESELKYFTKATDFYFIFKEGENGEIESVDVFMYGGSERRVAIKISS